MSTSRGLRRWIWPLSALVLSLGLGLLPTPTKRSIAGGLEHTVFYPFRFSIGWGARALAAAHDAKRMAHELTMVHWNTDEAEEAQEENGRLRRLLGFRRRSDYELVPCPVVGRERGPFGELLLVEPADRQSGVLGRPVVAPEGLIGRVAGGEGRYARVECLNHVQMAVSVINQRSREGGILKWSPEHNPELAIVGLPSQSDWQPGDRLVTSGLGTAFPRGVLVGWVVGQRSQRGGLLKEVRVRAAASAGRVEEVFLLVRREGSAVNFGPEGTIEDVSGLFPADGGARVSRMQQAGLIVPGPGPAPVP
jgi:rod shape-determining protein MreC